MEEKIFQDIKQKNIVIIWILERVTEREQPRTTPRLLGGSPEKIGVPFIEIGNIEMVGGSRAGQSNRR